MIICSCNMLSDRDVRRVVTGAGAQQLTAGQVYDCLGCNARCGRCARTIKRIMQEALAPCEAGCEDRDRQRKIEKSEMEQQAVPNRGIPHQALQQNLA